MTRSLAVVLLVVFGGLVMAADETEILFGPGVPAKWDAARDANRLNQELSQHELKPEADGLRWRFVSKGPPFNDIFLRRDVQSPFTELRVKARNEGAALQLALKVRDAKGGEWTVPRIAFPAGTTRTFQFPVAKWVVASWSKDANGVLDFPLSSVTVIAFDVKTGTPYDLLVQEVAAVRPEPPVATIHSLSVPGELRAGGTVPFSVEFSLDRPCLQDLAVVDVHADGQNRFRFPLALSKPLSKLVPGERVQLRDVPLAIPPFA
ncbi:MAG: hypothetical protein HN904_07410, partial [Victivallales bacterium]|nr:hypothetical protein [Victivallales bacterium]